MAADDEPPSSGGWLRFAIFVAFAVGWTLLMYWARQHRLAIAARGIQERPNPHVFGWVCFALASFGAILNYWSYTHGWMYGGRTRRVYRAERPKEFRFWVIVQWLIVGVLLYLACNTLLFR